MAQDATTVLAFDLGATQRASHLGSLDRGSWNPRTQPFPTTPSATTATSTGISPASGMKCRPACIWRATHPPPGEHRLRYLGVDYAFWAKRRPPRNPLPHRDQRTHGDARRGLPHLGADRIYDATGIQFMGLQHALPVFAASRRDPKAAGHRRKPCSPCRRAQLLAHRRQGVRVHQRHHHPVSGPPNGQWAAS